ncbi:MAG: hypothetical protein Q8Q69_07330 [Nitrosopumilaceae archaeon]|nr:hypothetical protein [Nitrosopumilaceae archaeon]
MVQLEKNPFDDIHKKVPLATKMIYLENGIKDEFLTKFTEPFIPGSDFEALEELEDLISRISVNDEIAFRANHSSIAFTIGSTFLHDKNVMLKKISWVKKHPVVRQGE